MSIVVPTFQLDGTKWLAIWKEKEREDFVRMARVIFPLIGLAVLANYYFFDRAVGLKPEELWLMVRTSMALVAFSVAGFYYTRFSERFQHYKLPAIIAGVFFCYMQGRVLEWYSADIYVYVYAYVVLSVVIVRLAPVQSLILGVALLAVVWPSFIAAQIDLPLVISGGILTLVTILLLRSGYGAEVRHFSSQQENLEAQRRIIELTIEFSDRIRAFLPREVTARMDEHLRSRQMSIFQAAEEVMRPQVRNVSCLFSDIRGFTSATKSFEGFIQESVLPNVKECARVVEEERGIPRKIGDLIFAYFDIPDAKSNLLHCVRAAAKLIDRNKLSNSLTTKTKITRHVFLSTGRAVVGNLGGFDSSIEITALGDPVNFLARLDEASKQLEFSELLVGDEIVLDERSAAGLREWVPCIELDVIELRRLGVTIRDFPEVEKVLLLRLSTSNRAALNLPEDPLLFSAAASRWNPKYDDAFSDAN